MKYFYLILTALIMHIAPTTGYSEFNVEQLEQMSHDLRIEVRHLLLDYYHLQADETNHTVLISLNKRKSDADSSRKDLTSLLPSTYQSEINRLNDQWSKFSGFMAENIHVLTQTGYPELQVVTLMRNAARDIEQILTQLGEQLRAENEIHLPVKIAAIRQQQIALMNTIELYGEYGATSTGVPIATDGSTHDIGTYCARFEESLKHLEALDWSVESRGLLKNIRSKWRFIDRTVKRHSEGMVPFLVMRYTDMIMVNLNKAQASL